MVDRGVGIRGGRGLLSALAGVLALTVLAHGPPSSAHATSGPSVEFKDLSKSSILSERRIPVALTVKGERKVRVSGRVRGDGRSHSARITKRRSYQLRDGKPETVRLKLTHEGTRRLRNNCGKQTLIVQVRVRGADQHRRTRETAKLVSDQPRCGGPGSPPGSHSKLDYEVTPPNKARHTNGTPRGYQASGIGSDDVLIRTFACSKVRRSGTEFAFIAKGGGADRGSPSGEVSSRSQSGSSFAITGKNGCAQPVIFKDRDGDGRLGVDSAGRPTESYGVGGEVSFEPMGDVDTANASRCDILDDAVCLQPFPSDYLTKQDPTTATGRRINFNALSMPRNRAGEPILPTDHNRADGYSPGSMLITKVPGLTSQAAFDQSGLVPIDDLEQWDDPDQAAVVIDADTGERWPIWAEIDSNPSDPADVNLLMRPQQNWLEGHRYIVALRNLKRADGSPIEASRAFQLYRDGIVTSNPAIESRRGHMRSILGKLSDAGVERSELFLAWDFTVASAESLAGRMLSIRNRAFAQLGDTNLADLTVQGSAPTVTIDSVENFTPQQNSNVARRVKGKFIVPCYLDTAGCAPGGQFILPPGSEAPVQNATPAAVEFECNIPHSAFAPGAEPARPSLYGHGLLGGYGEVEAGNVTAMGQEHNMIFCATDWAGFSTKDAGSIALILQDLNNFPKLVDGSQQGFLNFAYLGRAMIHPDGLSAQAAFQDDGGNSLIDARRLFYDGNSQGGILGGSLVAVEPDLDRGVLGVPGMNYSTLLRRSTDFNGYATGALFGPDTPLGLYDSYPNELERPLILSLIQMLWDRGEANGYAEHMTDDPLPNTPPHEVLMHVAFGDHQVTNVAAQVEARTIGARTNAALDPGRIPGIDPLFGIPQIGSYPYDGSAIIYWDSGPPRDGVDGVFNPPLTNTYPTQGRDPHGDPRGTVAAREQKSAFLQIGGKVIDVCGGTACHTDSYTAP